jgi:hypothetical protein
MKHTLQIEVEFETGEIVWHRNGESDKGLITGYRISGNDVLYDVCWGRSREVDSHFDYELSSEPIFGFIVGAEGEEEKEEG